MDWMPLLIGVVGGVGNAALQKFSPNSPSGLGRHKLLLYRLGLVGVGAYGEYSRKLSPDLSYGLMVTGAALLGSSIPNAIGGGGLNSFGDEYVGEVPFEVEASPVGAGWAPAGLAGPGPWASAARSYSGGGQPVTLLG